MTPSQSKAKTSEGDGELEQGPESRVSYWHRRWYEVASQLDSAIKRAEEAEARAESATVWLGRVLALDHPPRNEPGIDAVCRQQAREALGRLRDGG